MPSPRPLPFVLSAVCGFAPLASYADVWLPLGEEPPSGPVPLSRPLPAMQRYDVSERAIPQADLRIEPLPDLPALPERRRDPRLMKIGGLLLAIGYAPAVAVALALSSQAGQPGGPNLASNYTLLVPALGPVASGIIAPATSPPGSAGAVVTGWTLPILLSLGLIQGTGGALLIHGATPQNRTAKTGSDPLGINFPPWRTN